MKIYDISQEVFESVTYPGDPKPQKQVIMSMKEGALYNLTGLSMGVHNGTHIDAPAHFIKDGKTIDEIPLDDFVGTAYVYYHNGKIDSDLADRIIAQAREACGYDLKILLIRGRAAVSFDGAQVLARCGLTLLGCEYQSIATADAVIPVHRLLLDYGVKILEGLRLDFVEPGRYFLCAAPLKLGNTEGAPCRAFLIDFEHKRSFWK